MILQVSTGPIPRLRPLARRYLPYELRVRIALLRRALRDRRSGVVFAEASLSQPFPFKHSTYRGPMIDYPRQVHVGPAKRRNQRLLAAALDGAVLGPGETFSLWRRAGPPIAAAGYAEAAAIRAGRLVTELGGATCLLSTVVYNAALLAGLEITERWCHSVDTYGDQRYFELGRDAAIVYGYRDLRFRNPFGYPVRLGVEATEGHVEAVVTAEAPRDFEVQLEVSEPLRKPHCTVLVVDPQLPPGREVVVEPGYDGLRCRTTRIITWTDGKRQVDDLGSSHHVMTPRILACAPAEPD